MIYYTVYNKKALRQNCKCGYCINRDGHKNSLSTWHTSPLVFTTDIDWAYKIQDENPNSVMFSQEKDSKFKNLSDKKIVDTKGFKVKSAFKNC